MSRRRPRTRPEQPGRERGDQHRAEHVHEHQRDRQVGEVLHEADRRPGPARRPAGPGPPGGPGPGRRWRRARASSATVSPISRKTTSACSWLIFCGSRPVRPAFGSPLCGPLPVTDGADRPARRRSTATMPGESSSERPARAAAAPTPGSRERSQSVVATATSTIDSRKCAPTSHGLRPVSTVMPPSSACAGMPRKLATASGRRSRRAERQHGDDGRRRRPPRART